MRYAIYFLPEQDTEVWNFGSAVLGFDCISARAVPQMALDGLPSDLMFDLTAEPRRYGFHATLKAPFQLLEGSREDDLLSAVANISCKLSPIEIGRLKISQLKNFLALIPVRQPESLDSLAGHCVQALDRFRAPLTAQEMQRRLASHLSPRQVKLLSLWGYPYVFDQFRLHMTLTGPVPEAFMSSLLAALESEYKRIDVAITITSICVCFEAAPGRPFQLLKRFPLGSG